VLDVIVVGCGPYGLAAAAHLRAAGVETRVFGEPMQFWRRHAPTGMCLRSALEASAIGSPDDNCTFASYLARRNGVAEGPIPVSQFIEYGEWFQNQFAPDLDSRRVSAIVATISGLQVQLEDGETFKAKRVVIASGIAQFTHRLPAFNRLPATLVSHSTDTPDLSGFSGLSVVVIGGGQSAIETAALLSEAGAEVEVIMRAPWILWLRGAVALRNHLGLMGRMMFPWTDVGSPPWNQIIARPALFRQVPARVRQSIDRHAMRPSVAAWLKRRIGNVKLSTSREVRSASASGNKLRVVLDDSSERFVDHAIMATGFRLDLARLPFLSKELLQSIETTNGYPRLNVGFESSVDGLHFLGAPAAYSFGPLTRFVAGTKYSAGALLNFIRQPKQVIENAEPSNVALSN
jgi:cation diffusion facilitator CzcD-associated flavoprotein CzcO